MKLAALGTGAIISNGCKPGLTPPTSTSTATSLPTEEATSAATATPDPRKLCFVLWDHQLAKYDYKPRKPGTPLPETCPLYSGDKNPITPAWEAYWKGILHLCNPDMKETDFESSWNSLVVSGRAFTDFSDPASGNFALHSLTCGGATHEMVTGVPEGKYMRIYTLNSRKDPPPIPEKPEEIDITRHFFATTGSDVQLPDGSYAVYGFPQFENCIIPLMSREDTDLIDISRIKVVTNIQRPYNT